MYYVICSCTRSGSSLLAEALLAMGAGKPDEFFNRVVNFRDGKNHKLGLRDDYMQPTPQAYFERKKQENTVNGIFGLKTHYKHLALFPDPLTYYLPDAKYISITRRNILRQVVSAARAAQTQAWTIYLPEQKRPRLNYIGILKHLIAIAQEIELWERFYKEHGIRPLRVVYEDLEDNYEATMRRVVDFLGISGDIPPPPLVKQADALNEAWISSCIGMFRSNGRFMRAFRYMVERW